MISTGLPSTKPAIAAAVPVKEFRRLMTTGMSAPPMGRTIVTPKMRPASTTTNEERQRRAAVEVRTPAAPRISAAVPRTAMIARAIVTSWPPGT